MPTSLDTSPQARLRLLASQLRLPASTADDALAMHRNDMTSAERMLRNLAVAPGGARRVGTSSSSSGMSREDRFKRAAAALTRSPDGKPTCEAVDLLHTSLSKVLASPLNERLRKVNVAAFKSKVPHPAGIELLHTAGYEPMHGHLVLQKFDPALLSSALSALSEARTLSTYVDAKTAKEAAQVRKQAADLDAEAAAARRAAFLAKVPAEPKAGDDSNSSSACVITISQGASAKTTRRFDSDNTLTDLVNFIKSLPQTPEGGALTVENVTTRPARVLDVASQGEMSLYSLDLWPIGKILVHAEVVCMV